MTTALPVPDEAVAQFRRLCSQVVPREEMSQPERVAAIARPVVVAELLALATRLNTITAPAGVDQEGFDAGIGAALETIADRCAELGVKVEEL